MEVSKLTLSEEMIKAMHNPGITQKHKRELREKLIIDYIRNKPSGTKITKAALCRAAQYNDTPNEQAKGYHLISQMIKKSVIAFIEPGKKTNNGVEWYIPGDAKETHVTIRPIAKSEVIDSTHKVEVDLKQDDEDAKESTKESEKELGMSRFEFEYLAKLFAWEENSDSLREFVKWLKQNDRI